MANLIHLPDTSTENEYINMPDTTKTENPDEGLSIFDICETDTSAEEDGRWFRDIFGDNTNIDVKLRRLSSRQSLVVRRRLDKGYRKYMKNGQYPEEIAHKVLIEQVAEAVLIDWAGIKDRNREAITYSKEAAVKLLTLLPHFRDTIVMMAANLDNFRVEEKEAALGNS